MAATLQQILLAPDVQPQVNDDCYALIQHRVSEMPGISGAAVKVAYKTVSTVFPGHIKFMVESLVPQLAERLEPYWTDFTTSGGAEFGDYLAKRGDDVSQALIAVTDERAKASGRPVVVKAYNSVRGSATRHIEAALPDVGALVQKYAC